MSNYTDNGFWSCIKTYSAKLGREALYNGLLLYYVMGDANTPVHQKALIAGALGYLILPLDAVPDVLPLVGLTDDASALLAAVKSVADSISEEHKASANSKLESWFG